IEKYEAVMQLYTGSYLQEYNYLWADSERYRLEQIWLKTAYNIANIYYDHGDLENAESWYIQICTLRPEDDHAHFSLMELYASMGYGLL
ncbi:bacterial transcriptional activator domain-containing protein, partial [Salmonella enterica]